MRPNPSILVSWLLICAFAAVMAPAARAKDEKLKPEQLIAKHLESIGAAAKLKEIKTRSTSGTSQVVFVVGGAGNLSGQGSVVSSANSVRAAFTFPVQDYRGEEFVFDGDKISVAQISPGVRSPVGRFIYENDSVLKEGLLFGSLSTSWALLNTAAKQPRLDSAGLKKINGRELYELKYEPRRGKGNVLTTLYFDPETFRHVRSQYKVEVAAPAPNRISDSAEVIHYLLIEEFDQFQEVDGLTLPRTYKLEFSIEGPGRAFVGNWTYTIREVVHNQVIDPQVFVPK